MNVTGHEGGHTHTIPNWYNTVGVGGHQHTWDNTNTVVPTAGMMGGGVWDNSNIRLNSDYINTDMQVNAERIMFQNKNLTKAVEDMALLLKIIVEKYDLHEVKELMESSEVAVWAKDGEYRAKDICEEKKDHLDEKLFEI